MKWLPAAACLALTGLAIAQAPIFDVATVKRPRQGRNGDGMSYSSVDVPSPGRFVATNASIEECVRWAYQVKEYQVAGPKWLNSDEASYDIEAKAPPNTTTSQMRLMVQALLAERFHLALHREKRILPIYALVTTKAAPKLRKSSTEGKYSHSSGGGRMTETHTTMEDFAYQLSRETNHVVVDRTGIAGIFDIALEYGLNGDTIFTAIQAQLGLRLESTKGEVEVLVIDRVEKVPTEN